MFWASEGDLGRVRETLGRGAKIDVRDTEGSTALHLASRGGHLAVVRELLDHGADVNSRASAAGQRWRTRHTAVIRPWWLNWQLAALMRRWWM